MHPVNTVKHWGHGLHDGMLSMWHQMGLYFTNRHFWTGVGFALLIIGLLTLIVVLARYTPAEPIDGGVPMRFYNW